MANRNFANGGKIMQMDVAPVITTVSILIGATGAVTSFISPTVQSIVRNSTGSYTITLQPSTNFAKILGANSMMISPVSGLSGIDAIELSNTAPVDITSLSAPGVTIKCLNPAGAAADPASGSTILFSLMTSNSQVAL